MANELRDVVATEVVSIQIGPDNRVWVNVDERCVLRVIGAPVVEISDMRTAPSNRQTKPCPGCGDEIPADATRCAECDLLPGAAAVESGAE